MNAIRPASRDDEILELKLNTEKILENQMQMCRDIREIKELQQSLVHAGRLAAIGELASGVAHDINNPLTVILLSHEIVLAQLKDADSASNETLDAIKRHTENAQKASQSIQKLSEHLRNFSRGMAELSLQNERFLQALIISRHSSALRAIGFSHITCLPALAALMVNSLCMKFGSTM